ncbi:Ig-like domain-containing protein [Aquitalea aquatilis]|uniref:Ig-like domain-containing protein n=1 Tax=Aquitalea aquatilis TaxID=1537400 RepID=UPI0010BD943E|nr:Ig-like domain-containing protein [Aquitalea aquatilis]
MINGSAINSAAINASAGSESPVSKAEKISVPVVLMVTALPSGFMSVPMGLNVLPVSLPAESWNVRVLVGGVDLSDRVEGELEIEAEEGAARIASVVLSLAAGDSLASFGGQSLVIDVRPIIDSAWVRRFTGRVVLPQFDLESGRVALHAADRRRDLLAQSSRSALAAMLGGYWSDHVGGEAADSLQYAEGRLATVAGSFDLDAYGNPRLTEWAGSGQSTTVTDDDIKANSLEVKPVALSDVTNLVTNDQVGLGTVSTTSICGLIHDSANDTGKSTTDNLTANTRPLIGGTVEPGATVTLTIGGQSVVTTASGSGYFAVQPPYALALGIHTPHITVTSSWTWEAWGTSFTVVTAAEANEGAVSSAASEKVASTDCTLEYRYPRLHLAETVYQWSMGISYPELVLGRNGHAFILPERSLFESAASQSSWIVDKTTYTSPKQGSAVVGYIDRNGNVINGAPGPAADVVEVLIFKNEYTGAAEQDPRCEAATLWLHRRIAQPVTERWRVTVSAPDSVAALGTRKTQGATAAVDATSSFNADAWEKDLKVDPVIKASTDYTSLPTVSRADIDAALVCLAAKARRQILASHRASRVTFTTVASATLDLSQRLQVDSADLHAIGKVARFVERYAIDSGRAETDIELAISALVGVGTAQDEPLQSPVITGAANLSQSATVPVPSAWEGQGDLIAGTSWTTGATGDTTSQYPRSVALTTNAIHPYMTDPIDRPLTYAVTVAIPVDPFELR